MLSTSRWMGKTQVRGTESCVGGMETNSFLLVALRLAWRPGDPRWLSLLGIRLATV